MSKVHNFYWRGDSTSNEGRPLTIALSEEQNAARCQIFVKQTQEGNIQIEVQNLETGEKPNKFSIGFNSGDDVEIRSGDQSQVVELADFKGKVLLSVSEDGGTLTISPKLTVLGPGSTFNGSELSMQRCASKISHAIQDFMVRWTSPKLTDVALMAKEISDGKDRHLLRDLAAPIKTMVS